MPEQSSPSRILVNCHYIDLIRNNISSVHTAIDLDTIAAARKRFDQIAM